MGIFLVIIILIILCWPMISKWMQGFLARRTEDYLRKATGMPPRPGSREAKRQARQQQQQTSNAYSSSSSRRSGSRSRNRQSSSSRSYSSHEPLIPKEYAEDVEFVETISYSETSIGPDYTGSRTVYHESQVSDAEWVEIKKKR